jgi:hypothetical protein
VQIGKPQNFLGASVQIHGAQICIVFARGKNGANQLPDPRAVEIRNVAQIQEDPLSTVSKKIPQQFVNSLALNQRKASADVHDRDVTYLPSTGTKTQCAVLRDFEPVILSHTAVVS